MWTYLHKCVLLLFWVRYKPNITKSHSWLGLFDCQVYSQLCGCKNMWFWVWRSITKDFCLLFEEVCLKGLSRLLSGIIMLKTISFVFLICKDKIKSTNGFNVSGKHCTVDQHLKQCFSSRRAKQTILKRMRIYDHIKNCRWNGTTSF